MTKFVLCTASNDLQYADYDNSQDVSRLLRQVVIRGKANIPSSNSGYGVQTSDPDSGLPIWTAQGMITSIKDETAEWLKDNWLFKREAAAGIVKILNDNPGNNHDIVAKIVQSDMLARDKSAPMTQDDLGGFDVKRVLTGRPTDEHDE
jgi:hypothetical protein